VYASFNDADVAADYRQLLRRGSLTRRLALDQHTAYRRALRAEARADGMAVRTWSRATRPATVWAVLPDWRLTREERAALAQRISWLQEE
jgi:hypothetical protein